MTFRVSPSIAFTFAPQVFLIFVVALLVELQNVIFTRVDAVDFKGTYYHHFPAYDNLNLTAVNQEASSVAPDQAFHIHQFAPLPDSAGFTAVPILMSPICIAYNASNVVGGDGAMTFDISLETLGEWMMGTLPDWNTSLTPHRTIHRPIGTAQFRLVLAQNSPTTRAILERMTDLEIPGFTSSITLSAQVLANPNITWVADEFAAIDLMHNGDGFTSTHGLVTFISVAHGALLPCASLIIPTSEGRQSRIANPLSLASANPDLFTLEPDSFNFTYHEGGDFVVYPLFGAVFLSYPNNPICADGARSRAAIEFVQKIYTDNVFFERLKKWGMLAPSAETRRATIGHLVHAMPCASATGVPAGGAGVTDLAMSRWVLNYYAVSRVFIDFEISNASVGLQAVVNREFGFAGLDEPLTSAHHPQDDPVLFRLTPNKNLRVFPISAMAVSVVFNIPGVNSLTLPLCSILALFNGTITRWSDPILQQFNPEAAMPDAPVNIIAALEDSGTTELFTHGLAEVDERCNFQKHGSYETAVEGVPVWPLHIDTVVSSDEEIAESVLSTPYSIGILASPAATKDTRMQQAWLVNETTMSLSYPSQDLVLESLNFAKIHNVVAGDFDRDIVAEAAKSGYPFFGLNYMAFEDNQGPNNCSNLRQGLEFFMWIMTSEKGRGITADTGFIPLPSHLNENGVSKLIDAKCGGLYVFPQLRTNTSSFELSKGAIAGIAAGSAAFVVFLIVAFVFLYTRGKKSSKYAPKDSTVPMALVFTDIQASTALWSVAPQTMAAALDLHNEIIERNIDKYSAYKVKTIGDAFMICVQDIENAHEMCLAIQRDLYNAEWPSEEIDIAYAEILHGEHSPYQTFNPDGSDVHGFDERHHGQIKRKKVASPLYENRMNPQLFRGLSVRIGMTWGCAEPHEDPVTGTYDYVGSAVNEASRCESAGHGGQVIYSASAVSALRDAGVDLTDTNHLVVTSLGKQPLKGIPAPVELYQVLPAEFAGRRFPPLRLDNDGSAMNQQIEEENSNTKADTASTESTPTAFYVSLTTISVSTAAKSDVKRTSPGASTTSNGHSDSSLGDDENHTVPADFRFARYLARIDHQQPKIYLFLFDTLSCALAATPKEVQRQEIIKKISADWRVQDLRTKNHLYFKKELGYEAYWTMRIAQKIAGAIRIKQEKRDPHDDLHCGLTFNRESGAVTPNPNIGVHIASRSHESSATSSNEVLAFSGNNCPAKQAFLNAIHKNNSNYYHNHNNSTNQHPNSAAVYHRSDQNPHNDNDNNNNNEVVVINMCSGASVDDVYDDGITNIQKRASSSCSQNHSQTEHPIQTSGTAVQIPENHFLNNNNNNHHRQPNAVMFHQQQTEGFVGENVYK